MKLCGIVVTFYPDVEESKNNILRYLPFLDHLIIWENTPKDDNEKYHIEFSENYKDKITILSTGKNEGIAFPLNKGAEFALSNGYTHLLTMDQDSKWDGFKFFRELITAEKRNEIAIFAPVIIDDKREINNFNTEDQVITSGSVISLKKYLEIGPFCEEFMIDCVDTEFAYRARLKKFKIKVISSTKLYQSFGNLKKVPILGCYHANYSPFRIYHIIRNSIWMWRMYRKTPVLPRNFFLNQILYWYFVREPILTLLCGKTKLKSIQAMARGVWDGIFNYNRNLSLLIHNR